MAAKVSTLSKLHEALTELFLEDIRICREEGIPMAASDKAVIVKFLKDNNISADVDDEDMRNLQDEFAADLDKRRKERAAKLLEAADTHNNIHGILQ